MPSQNPHENQAIKDSSCGQEAETTALTDLRLARNVRQIAITNRAMYLRDLDTVQDFNFSVFWKKEKSYWKYITNIFP